MVSKNVPSSQLKILDIACWDLHARMVKKPLHALLGTKKEKILRYGDVRGQQPDFSPRKYAENVARYLERTGMQATKLHFPGNMGTKESIPFSMILETLQAVRKAVGKDKILAWDPYPGSAESATTSVDEAKQILKLMDELGYAWIEGPLLPVPYETQIPKYVELVQTGTKQRIQAEGPGSPIGDGTSFADMKTLGGSRRDHAMFHGRLHQHRRHQLPADAGIREGSPTVGHQPALGLGPPRAPRDGL